MATAISGSNQEAVRQKGSTKCSNHRLKDVVYVCQDCKILLCTTCCIKSEHKTHYLEELSVVAQEKKVAMLDFVNLSENNTLPHLKDDLRSKDHQMTETSSEFKTLSSDMKVQGDKCKQEIDELIMGFTSICDEMERNNLELLRHQKKDKQHRYDVVSAEVEECKKALQTGNDAEIFDTDFDTLGSYTDTNPPVLQTCQYTPCTSITDHLKQAIGKFTTYSTDHSQTLVAATSAIDTLDQCQGSSTGHAIEKACTDTNRSTSHAPVCELLDSSIIMAQFPVSSPTLSMCPTQEGYLWILEGGGKTVLQVNEKGETKQKIELHNDTNDISVSPVTGRLWLCSDGRTIYEMKEPATPVPKFKTKDKPCCLSITNDGVVVATESSVTIHTVTGSVLHTITKTEQSDFLPAFRISNCSVTGNIAVIHGTENREIPYNLTMYIAVYDRTLNHLFTYSGEGIRGQQPVTPETFGPWSVDYDSFGNVIIADVKRKTIELLSGTGQYLRTLNRGEGIRGQQPGTPETFGPRSGDYDSINLILADFKRTTIKFWGTGQYLRTLYSGEEYQGVICIGPGNTLWSRMWDGEIRQLKSSNTVSEVSMSSTVINDYKMCSCFQGGKYWLVANAL